MKFTKLALASLLLSNFAYGYQDSDLDGIQNSVDQCPNTPFDAKVNLYGCHSSKALKPKDSKLTLSIGTTLRSDEVYEDDSSLSFYANYRYKKWNISLSNIRSITKNNYNQDSSSDDNIYLSTGYTTYLSNNSFKFTIGSKITDNSSENDYFASISGNHYLSSKQDIFIYYGYTLSGDTPTYDYKNYSSFSLGSGYLITKNYYSSLSYRYSQSVYNLEASQSILWYHSYALSKKIFATASYGYALDDISYDQTLSFSLGMYF